MNTTKKEERRSQTHIELTVREDDNYSMRFYVGTSGFAYNEWKGSFYPQDISSKAMLHYYSRRFNAVEINNTFYRMPNRELLKRWSQEVPDDFIFALKAPRIITHFKRLKHVEEETEHFVATTAELGAKMGPILFQLPVTLPLDLSRIAKFIEILHGVRAVFEFSHSSWLIPEIIDLLRSKNIALCTSDREPGKTVDIVGTANWGYLRLRRGDYSESDLAVWQSRIVDLGWERAYIFFKHESEGMGPKMAATFPQNS